MSISTETINTLIYLHHDLWDRKDEIYYYGKSYPVVKPENKGFAMVKVPSKSGKNIIYITQNLDKSSYGTLEILNAAKRNKTIRITWIVQVINNQYKYIGLIKTTDEYTAIERYSDYGTELLYHSDPNFKPIKSAY